ncbi:MAG: hypothetical protein JWN54_2879 [Mycobacterium sp.]|nr:hypothetical protein [Mycobacterium sp.]
MSTSAPEGQSSSDTSASTDSAISSGIASGDNEAVMRALAASIALLPQAPPQEGEERPEGAVALPVIEQDGTQYIPVFTSEEALRSAGADVGTAVRLPLVQLAANWPSDDLWLAVNPSSESGLSLPAEVVRALPVFAVTPDGDLLVDIPVDEDTEVIVDITDDDSTTSAGSSTTGAEATR